MSDNDTILKAGRAMIKVPTKTGARPRASKVWIIGISPAVGITNKVPKIAKPITPKIGLLLRFATAGKINPWKHPKINTITT